MSTPGDQLWAGVDGLLDDYAQVRVGDRVFIAYTPDSRHPAAWIATALKVRGIEPVAIAMNALEDKGFAYRLEAILPPPDKLTARLTVMTVERDTMSHTGVFREVLARYDKTQWSALRIINASAELFTLALKARPNELSALNTALLERLMPARHLRIKTLGGTDLRVTLDSSQYQWISNRGIGRPGRFMVLPAGEVATFPISVDGELVVDGAFNVNVFTRLDARLGEHPIKIRIKDSKAVDFECANPQVSRLLELVFDQQFARNVGELGFGTNKEIREFISMNSHINERRPGVHIGFGQHNQSIYLLDYECKVHLDMIASGGWVWVDDNPVPIDLARVMPSDKPHPSLVVDEDIDGDCCGISLDQMDGSCLFEGLAAAQFNARKKLEAQQREPATAP